MQHINEARQAYREAVEPERLYVEAQIARLGTHIREAIEAGTKKFTYEIPHDIPGVWASIGSPEHVLMEVVRHARKLGYSVEVLSAGDDIYGPIIEISGWATDSLIPPSNKKTVGGGGGGRGRGNSVAQTNRLNSDDVKQGRFSRQLQKKLVRFT